MSSQDNHIMLDLEALGTSRDCVVVSVGAVKFNLNTGVILDERYWELDMHEQQKVLKRTIDAHTITWWSNQTPDTIKALQSHKRVGIEEFITEFTNFIKGPNFFWAKGTNYDLEILTDLHKAASIWINPSINRTPFQYSKWVDARVYYLIGKELGIMPKHTNEGAHNALQDAIFQTKTVCQIHRTLKDSLKKGAR